MVGRTRLAERILAQSRQGGIAEDDDISGAAVLLEEVEKGLFGGFGQGFALAFEAFGAL